MIGRCGRGFAAHMSRRAVDQMLGSVILCLICELESFRIRVWLHREAGNVPFPTYTILAQKGSTLSGAELQQAC
jgi:hypothetical protein